MDRKGKFIVLDPTAGSTADSGDGGGRLAPRLPTLENKTLAVVNNGKRNSDVFLRYLLEGIQRRYNLKDVIWIDKDNPSRPMPDETLQRLKSGHAAVAGVGD